MDGNVLSENAGRSNTEINRMSKMKMAKKNKIYGILSTISVELPYETEKERLEAEKTNEEIKGLGRVFRGATDWGFKSYKDTDSYVIAKNPGKKHIPFKDPEELKSGDLVKIFKTVTDGDVLWQGRVNLDRSNYHHGYQKDMSTTDWSVMFFDRLPARLEKDGKVIYGALDPFCETGTEGVIWALHEYGKAGYEGLHCLDDGDKLTVFSNVRDGEVEWEGRLDFGPEKVSKIGLIEVMKEARHMDTKKWLELSWQNRPVAVTPK